MMDELINKTCSACGETKKLSEFSVSKRSEDGLKCNCTLCDTTGKAAIKAKYYQDHKEALAAQRLIYCENNKEAIATKMAEYYIQNKQTIVACKSEYYQSVKGLISIKRSEYYEQNKETIQARNSEYSKTPKGKLVSMNAQHKRRSVIKEGSVNTEQLQRLINSNKRCLYCDCEITEDNRHIDHFIPISKGGLHDIDNLVMACIRCNLVKGSKMPELFIATLSEVDQERILTINLQQSQ